MPTWDVSAGKGDGVLWRTDLGGWRSGALTVGDGAVLVGTSTPGDAPVGRDAAVLRCLDPATGAPRWRREHDRLPHRVNDIPGSPIQSTPAIDGGRAYYVSNRGELCCVNLADGKAVWTIDMPKDLGVFKRDVNDAGSLAPSAIVHGDAVYCVTGHGGDWGRPNGPWHVPNPKAPSFLAADKRTGKVLWSSNAPGKDILYGQWSTPAVATVAGRAMVLFPGGDGLLYAFAPADGALLWKVDCRGPEPWDRTSFVVAPPLVVGETAFVSTNRDYEQNGGLPRPIVAVDLRTGRVRWRYSEKDFTGTYGPMAAEGRLVFAAGFSGLLVAVDAATGQPAWRRRVEADGDVRGGVCLHDGRLYVAASNHVHVVSARDGARVGRYDLGGESLLRRTPVAAGGALLVASGTHLWALRPPR